MSCAFSTIRSGINIKSSRISLIGKERNQEISNIKTKNSERVFLVFESGMSFRTMSSSDSLTIKRTKKALPPFPLVAQWCPDWLSIVCASQHLHHRLLLSKRHGSCVLCSLFLRLLRCVCSTPPSEGDPQGKVVRSSLHSLKDAASAVRKRSLILSCQKVVRG